MHALDFYTSVCRHVMRAYPENAESWSDLRRQLPCLRQALGCYVCFNLLRDPMGPNHNVCRHFVCKQCVGGKMKLKPSCSWCKDHWLFVPNPMLKILVTCFKKLCIYIYHSPLGEAIANSCVNGETNHLFQILKDGIEFSDDYVTETSVSTVEQKLDASTSGIGSVASTSTGPSTSAGIDSLQLNNSLGISNESAYKSEVNNDDEVISVAQFSSSKRAQRKRAIKKSVTFMKKVAQNRSKLTMKQQKGKKILKNSRKGRLKGKTKPYTRDAPSDLEKIDVLEPAKKKIKVELHPPELKPLSSCNCGKSGNFNHLTCIGQRCPCYSMKLPCMGTCKCRGCRNPKKGPDYKGTSTCSSAVLRSGTRSSTECVNM